MDLAIRMVWVAGAEVHLTPIEFKLLAVLVRHSAKVVTQRQLLQEVWGYHSDEHAHYLRNYIHHLRHKLEADPAWPFGSAGKPDGKSKDIKEHLRVGERPNLREPN